MLGNDVLSHFAYDLVALVILLVWGSTASMLQSLVSAWQEHLKDNRSKRDVGVDTKVNSNEQAGP